MIAISPEHIVVPLAPVASLAWILRGGHDHVCLTMSVPARCPLPPGILIFISRRIH